MLRFPVRIVIVRASRLFDLARNLTSAVLITMLFQRQCKKRSSISLQLASPRKQIIHHRGVNAATLRKHVNHVNASVGIDRLSVITLAGAYHFHELVAAFRDTGSVHGVSRARSQRQPVYDVCSHKRISLVILPPTPSAVAVLKPIEPVHPSLHLRSEIVCPAD